MYSRWKNILDHQSMRQSNRCRCEIQKRERTSHDNHTPRLPPADRPAYVLLCDS